MTTTRVVSYSISTSNHNSRYCTTMGDVVVSYSISTSNHNIENSDIFRVEVVSYSISTSNHNWKTFSNDFLAVVSYSISTSNHNKNTRNHVSRKLYLIPFLHQTTTLTRMLSPPKCCILFHFYIKPQHAFALEKLSHCCILFHFYIKPQQEFL